MADGDEHPQDYIAALGRGMQPSDVRQVNQRAVLTLIAMDPGISNAGLARRTGLAPQTVSAVLVDLESQHLITRGKVLRGKRGQPATPLFLNPRGAFAVGAEIGWNHIRVTLVGLAGDVYGQYQRSYSYPDAETIFGELATAVTDVTGGLDADERQRLIGVGLAAPGGIGDTSALLPPPGNQASLWASIDLAKSAAEVTGLDVIVFNDGNAACTSEIIAYPQPKPENAVFLLIDTLVAAGILGGNRLLEGASGAAANIGSMLVRDRDGEFRFVNELASLHALQRRLEAVGLGLDAVTAEPAPVTLAGVLERWVDDAGLALARALLNTTTIIDYEIAIIEAVLPPSLTKRIIGATEQHAARLAGVARKAPRIVAGHLGRSGVAEGAAQLRLYRRFISRDL